MACRLLASLIVGTVLAGSAHAQNVTWTAGTGTWSVGGPGWSSDNWTSGTAVFLASNQGTVTVSGSVAPLAMSVNGVSGTAANFTFTGGTIASTGNMSFATTSNRDATATLASNVSTAGTTLVTNGTNSIGTVTQQGNYISTSAADGAFRVGGGEATVATWTVSSGTLSVVAMTDAQNFVNVGFSTGSRGTLDVNGGTAYFRRIQLGRSTNSGTGTLKLQAGALALTSLQSANNLGTYSFELSGGTLRPYDGALTIGNATAANNFFDITLTGSNATITTSNVLGSRNTVSIYSAIKESGGSQGLAFTGTSVGTSINLYGAATYTGETTVGTVQLRLFNQNALGGTTLNWTGVGAMVFDSSVSGNAFTFGGLKGNRALALQNNAGTPAPITLSVGANNQSTAYSGILSGSGSLRKVGSGTFALGAANTFTGATSIDAGTLQVNGSLSASSAVTVASAATLAGSGTIGGPVSILAGGIVAPGTSPGTLTINNTFALAGTSLLDFELNPANTAIGGGINDLITGVTNLTLDGTLNISGAGDWTSVADNSSWRLFNYSGSLTDNGLTLGTTPSLGGGRSFQLNTATAGQVNIIVVPEPGAAIGAGIGIVVAALVGRRHRTASTRR
jgi:fibronectin-binding autotransporter adhesin